MALKSRIIIMIGLLLALVYIVNMVRKRQMELKYVLAWLMCDCTLLIFICVPNLMNIVADVLGIRSPMNMIFFLGFVFSLIIIYSLTLALSRVTAKVRRMAQIMALDKYEEEKFYHMSEKNN